MYETLLFVATFFSAIAMSQALAHLLEYPGKMRLQRDQYYTVQTIYYPGFTVGGLSEPLAILLTAAALLLTPRGGADVPLVAGAFVLLIVTQLLFWLVVQPVNRQWLQSIQLSPSAERFFHSGEAAAISSDWTKLRDRWERGHLARAFTTTLAFILLLMVPFTGGGPAG